MYQRKKNSANKMNEL